MKVTIIGANGQLGSDLVTALAAQGNAVLPLTHSEIELSSVESVRACLAGSGADAVINTAAMHHVENCEQNPVQAFAVNAIGARNLAIVTSEIRAVLLHISTDYVFDGGKGHPYIETDTSRPLNVYGTTKLAGEHFVQALNPRHFVLRTSALYGTHPCRAKGGRNFVDLMIKLGRERGHVRVIDSEFVSPTATAELANQAAAMINSNEYGLYHATAEGSCSWFEFAREIFSAADISVKLEPASSAEFPAKVARPRYSVLENNKLKRIGLNLFRPWQDGLHDYLRQVSRELSTTAY